MKHIFYLLAIQALVVQVGFGQSLSPYRWKTGLDIGLAVGGGGALAIGRGLSAKLEPLTLAQLAALDPANISPSFDRNTSKNWSPSAAKASDFLKNVAVAAPLVLLLSQDVRENNLLLTGAMALETYLVTFGLTELTKNLAHRTRPFAYNPDAPLAEKLEVDTRRSFFSGHTSMSAAGCFFAAKIWTDFHPDSKWKPWVWAGAAALPAVVGLHRVLAGKHFPTDVLTGYAVGGLAGWLIPELHKKGGGSLTTDVSLPAYLLGNVAVVSLSLTF